jgi:hypothetical protein
MQPEKVLLIDYDIYTGYKTHHERYSGNVIVSNREPTAEVINSFLEGLDVVFTVETPYNPDLYEIARRRGVKTVCQYNYEWLQHHQQPELPKPDLFLSPSKWKMEEMKKFNVPVKYLHVPVDRRKFPFKLRKQAKVFLHIAGHKTMNDRNGTALFMDCMPYIQSQVDLVIRTQDELPRTTTDHRLTILRGDPKDREEIFRGEVLVLPRRYGGLSLQLNEALSLGMVPIMLDTLPQNEFLDKDLLVTATRSEFIQVKTSFESYACSPETLANKIDELAGMDISEFSKKSDSLAKQRDWKVMKNKYEEIFRWVIEDL